MDLIKHYYQSNQSALMTRCRTDFRHQYRIFCSELRRPSREMPLDWKRRRTAVFSGYSFLMPIWLRNYNYYKCTLLPIEEPAFNRCQVHWKRLMFSKAAPRPCSHHKPCWRSCCLVHSTLCSCRCVKVVSPGFS